MTLNLRRGVSCLGVVLCATVTGCIGPDGTTSDDLEPSDWGAADGVGETVDGAVMRVRAVGDIMMGTDFPAGYLPPNDGAEIFDDVSEWLQDASITFGNLEGPLCDDGTTDKCEEGENCYAFRTPTRYGQYLREAGFDVVSLANNHALDFGESCRASTEATLDELGIGHSGRPGTYATILRGGARIGLIAFHTAPHSNWLNDHEAAAELVRTVDEDHDLVFVSFHGGAEGEDALHVPDGREYFYGEDRGDLRRFARAVIDAGADLVLGSGPHVPRGVEVYQGRLIAYSLGNFATYGRFSLSGSKSVSLVLEAQLDAEGQFVAGWILPVRLINGGFPVQDGDGTSIDLLRDLSDADFPDTGAQVLDQGFLEPPQ